MQTAEHESNLKLTTDIPYLSLTGELYFEDIGENWPRYNGTALYNNTMIVTKVYADHDNCIVMAYIGNLILNYTKMVGTADDVEL